MTLRIAGTLALLLLCGVAHAAEVWHTSTLKRIYPLANGSIVLQFDSESASCTATTNPKYYNIVVGQNGVTTDGLRNMLAVALTAFSTGRSISIAFDDASPSCYVNRLQINP